MLFSLPSHTPSPQHELPVGGTKPGSQSTGQPVAFSRDSHTPFPQHPLLHPPPLHWQSAEQEKQFSPLALPAQIASPQVPPVPLMQSAGHVVQSSPGSQVPLPQSVQSLSLAGVQPAGQHPSPFTHSVIGSFEQFAEQAPGLLHVSVVQALASLQSASAEQTGAVHVPPQQTPPVQTVSSGTAIFEHEAEHVPELLQVSVVHSLASLQSAPLEQTGTEHVPAQQTPPVQAVLSSTTLFEQEAEQVPGLLHVSVVHSFASLQSASAEHVSTAQVPAQQTPPLQTVLSGTEVFWQTPPTQASSVHSFKSSQSAAAVLTVHSGPSNPQIWVQI